MAEKRILLIDGERAILEPLRQALDQAGYKTITATDGHQGLALVQAWSPDLIVLDLLLPGRSGFEICESLKSDQRRAHIPIVALTRLFITPEDVEQGLEIGGERYLLLADAYLSKPPVYEQLLRQIRILLGQEAAPPAPKRDLVLVIDDDAPSRESLAETLAGEGYAVVTAKDGQEGWTSFRAMAPSLVLAAVRLPGLSGLEVLARIRQENPDVAVILTAAPGSAQIAAQAMDRGADGYLVKPFQPWRVVPAVRENLAKVRLRRLRQELAARLRDGNACLVEKHRALEEQNLALQEVFDGIQEAERRRRNLVSMIVHDLKNQLNAMLMSMDLLAADFGDLLGTVRRNVLNDAGVAGQQMLSLLTNLLEVQRLEDGKMPVRPGPLNLSEMLGAAVHQMQPLAKQKTIALRLDAPPSLPYVLADKDLSLRVVTNLLDNAIKFTPFEGQILVSGQAADAGDGVVVAVADNGPGIPPEEQVRIFEEFAQMDQGLPRAKGSVGLGLAFCKLAVEAQGGRIWVESDVGQGARFKFVLPAWDKGAVPAP